jgi:hypothetical protein
VIDERLGAAAGWVWHQGSFSDCLPVWNETKDVCLLFVGENYVDSSDIDRLRIRGQAFAPGKASYLVHQYEEAGDDFFSGLNGIFKGFLLDLRAKQGRTLRFGTDLLSRGKNRLLLCFGGQGRCSALFRNYAVSICAASVRYSAGCCCVLQNRSILSIFYAAITLFLQATAHPIDTSGNHGSKPP